MSLIVTGWEKETRDIGVGRFLCLESGIRSDPACGLLRSLYWWKQAPLMFVQERRSKQEAD